MCFCFVGLKLFSTLPKRIVNQMSKQRDYQGCIEALNKLQSNAQYLRNKSQNHNGTQLKQVTRYLNRVGLSVDNLDELSVIHVAGTKGKGTTCALIERILREHGYKTGFFSSPHLVEVRERIRINGTPLKRQEFVNYFSKLYNELEEKKSDEYDMPMYFRFLTILAFMIFLEQKVDVAIIEVGIGGEFDCTNVLRKVPVVGITSLGLDHVALLGESLDKIAWQKSGIMKENCKAFTVPQPELAMEVLKKRAIEKKCQLEIVKDLHFKLPPNILSLNASLAVALSSAWITFQQNNNVQSLSKERTERALLNCSWPGRFQKICSNNINFYLDGAHTLESIKICSDWFKTATKNSQRRKALMFNVTGDRCAENLLKELESCHFNGVLFVTNCVNTNTNDNKTFHSIDDLLKKCENHKAIWLRIHPENDFCKSFPTINEALEFLKNQDQYDLLVTGSLQLVGSVLSIIEPPLD